MEQMEGLKLLRDQFPAKLISKLPKGTKAQNECPVGEKKKCEICGGFHHPKIIHLDYVGHAALTDRLLDADPLWTWDPLAYKDGLPAFDTTGGLWIKLTVCGHTRIGYGHAASSNFKEIGSREKEVIGDALRNAAMRFGAALDLWHKGDLHPDGTTPPEPHKEDVPDFPPVTEEPPQGNGENQEAVPVVISEAQRKRFYAIGRGAGKTDAEIKKFLLDMNGSESTSKILKAKYEYLCTEIASRAKADA